MGNADVNEKPKRATPIGFMMAPPEPKTSDGKSAESKSSPGNAQKQEAKAMTNGKRPERSILEDTRIIRMDEESQDLSAEIDRKHDTCSRKLRDLKEKIRRKRREQEESSE